MSRISFIAVVNEAVRDVCSKENVLRAYSATGLRPFNPKKVDISKYASSFASSNVQESPIKATCSSCMVKEVELHPLVRQGLIPKKIASAFVYTPPPTKSKSRSKIVSNARIITSEDVRQEVHLVEQRKLLKGQKIKRKRKQVEQGNPTKRNSKRNNAKQFRQNLVKMIDEEESFDIDLEIEILVEH